MSTTRDSEPPARESGTEGATADRTGVIGALTELRDALDDAIRRAYCAAIVEPVEGENRDVVRAIGQAAVIANPGLMRHLAGIQAAAWAAVEARVDGDAAPPSLTPEASISEVVDGLNA